MATYNLLVLFSIKTDPPYKLIKGVTDHGVSNSESHYWFIKNSCKNYLLANNILYFGKDSDYDIERF